MKLSAHLGHAPLALGDLIHNVEQSHHVFTRDELERIAGLLGAMEKAGMPAPAKLQQCIDELRDDLLPHLIKEERILFPYITALERDTAHPPHSCFGSIANPIRMMQIEHEHLKSLLITLRELTTNYAATNEDWLDTLYQALQGLDLDLQEHIYWEDDVLFPGALKLELVTL